jgi:hypothetical protein
VSEERLRRTNRAEVMRHAGIGPWESQSRNGRAMRGHSPERLPPVRFPAGACGILASLESRNRRAAKPRAGRRERSERLRTRERRAERPASETASQASPAATRSNQVDPTRTAASVNGRDSRRSSARSAEFQTQPYSGPRNSVPHLVSSLEPAGSGAHRTRARPGTTADMTGETAGSF